MWTQLSTGRLYHIQFGRRIGRRTRSGRADAGAGKPGRYKGRAHVCEEIGRRASRKTAIIPPAIIKIRPPGRVSPHPKISPTPISPDTRTLLFGLELFDGFEDGVADDGQGPG